MPVSISGNGVFTGLTTVETVDVKHPDSADVNIALADDGTIVLDSIPAAITAAIPKGIGLNVAQGVLATTFSASIAAGASSAITGLTASLACSSTSSKVLILVGATGDNQTRSMIGVSVTAGGTAISGALGSSPGSRVAVSSVGSIAANNSRTAGFVGYAYLHSPASTSSITYGVNLVNISSDTQTYFVNRSTGDVDNQLHPRATSTITVIEVAA
jgi:hypothetical protein